MRHRFSPRFSLLALLLLPVAFCVAPGGCSTYSPPKAFQKFTRKNSKAKTPDRLLSFWQPYAQSNPKGAPLRGVGGRILFYGDRKTKEPIKVDGELTIFILDANDTLPERSVPIKQAIFKRDALTHHYREDDLGFHGYDFFVPIDEVDNEEREVAVLAVFTEFKKDGSRGAIVHSSETASITLPGESRKRDPYFEERDRFRSLDSPRMAANPNLDREVYDAPSRNRVAPADYRDHEERSNPISQTSYENSRDLPYGEFPQKPRRAVETIELPERYAQAYLDEIMQSSSRESGEMKMRTWRSEPSEYEREYDDREFYYGEREGERFRSPMDSSPPQSNGNWPPTPNRFGEMQRNDSSRMNPQVFRPDERANYKNGNFRIQNDRMSHSRSQNARTVKESQYLDLDESPPFERVADTKSGYDVFVGYGPPPNLRPPVN